MIEDGRDDGVGVGLGVGGLGWMVDDRQGQHYAAARGIGWIQSGNDPNRIQYVSRSKARRKPRVRRAGHPRLLARSHGSGTVHIISGPGASWVGSFKHVDC